MIYDLENKILVEHGLDDVPYDGIVEGYFRADKLSDILRGEGGHEVIMDVAFTNDALK